MIDVSVIKGLVDAGSVVICLSAVWILWQRLNARTDAHIADLQRLVFGQNPMKLPPHTAGAATLVPSLN